MIAYCLCLYSRKEREIFCGIFQMQSSASRKLTHARRYTFKNRQEVHNAPRDGPRCIPKAPEFQGHPGRPCPLQEMPSEVSGRRAKASRDTIRGFQNAHQHSRRSPQGHPGSSQTAPQMPSEPQAPRDTPRGVQKAPKNVKEASRRRKG